MKKECTNQFILLKTIMKSIGKNMKSRSNKAIYMLDALHLSSRLILLLVLHFSFFVFIFVCLNPHFHSISWWIYSLKKGIIVELNANLTILLF